MCGTSYTVRIAVQEAKFTVNRQVAALSRANPGVSSAFLLFHSILFYCKFVTRTSLHPQLQSVGLPGGLLTLGGCGAIDEAN